MLREEHEDRCHIKTLLPPRVDLSVEFFLRDGFFLKHGSQRPQDLTSDVVRHGTKVLILGEDTRGRPNLGEPPLDVRGFRRRPEG